METIQTIASIIMLSICSIGLIAHYTWLNWQVIDLKRKYKILEAKVSKRKVK